jgi:hypothetical protein
MVLRDYDYPNRTGTRTLERAVPSSRSLRSLLTLCTVALACLLLACPTSAPRWPEDDGFDDHTRARVETLAEFDTLASVGPTGTAALKFVILGFETPKQARVRYLDARFYEFHDQWYWFRLLNDHPVPGTRERPLTGQSFASVGEIVEWVRSRQRPPPLGLRIIDDRVYSDHFYELAVHREQRAFGIGTIVHLPARPSDGPHPRVERWGFELEYSDVVDLAALERFFAILNDSLPDEIADQLHFIARSPTQTQLIASLRTNEHPLADRLTSYAELAVPGEIEVYNPGLIAGRLRKLPSEPALAAKLLTAGDPRAIWIMPTVPDELPAAAGLLTATPQTPLAHVNLLARNRGIPNVYVGGVLEDAHFDQLSRIHAPVVVLAGRDGSLTIEPISEAAYARWLGLSAQQRPKIVPLDPTTLPYVIDLEREPPTRVPELRRMVGGKTAGLVILHAAGVPMPERPLAITTRAYHEHLAELRPMIADALIHPEFVADARVRYLLLEGRENFDERFAGDSDQTWVEAFAAAHSKRASKRDALAQLLARDGIKQAIRERPIDPEARATLDAALRAHFGHFAASQGLRFRSSSTIEDIEGFSGAGLYDSNTGFLDPAAQASTKDNDKSIDWALRRTWASYWSWEAFEERNLEQIDHLAGDMAVLVHARFDDDLERSNAVLTLTLDVSDDRPGDLQAAPGPRASLEVDVQVGALSVTNPPPELAGKVLPEVDRVLQARADGPIRIERVARSTELGPPGEGSSYVLDDAALETLLRQTMTIAKLWLDVENQALSPARARSRVTLDLEVREVAAGWPAYASGDAAPQRLVIKQVRSLDPGPASGVAHLLEQPIPRDLLLFADRIEKRSCRGRGASLELLEVWTDPGASPPLGHADVPFLARLRLEARGLEGGDRRFNLDHLDFERVGRAGMRQGGPWVLDLLLAGAAASSDAVSLDRIESSAGLLRLGRAGRVLGEEPAPCTTEVLFASPDEFLRALLGPAAQSR